MGVLSVTKPDGERLILDAVEGWRVMEILRDHGLPVEGMCGGACACATCHVEVSPAWMDRLHPRRDDEEGMLDTVPGAGPNSRLSCQIIFAASLDGLELMLTDGAGI